MRPSPPSPAVLPLLFLVLALLLLLTPFSAAVAERTAALINEDGSTKSMTFKKDAKEGKEEGQYALKLGPLQSLAVLHFLR